ncbi:MAG: hypothetical protein RIQ56_749, partial [Candidatus Parcubacteria bacterium]
LLWKRWAVYWFIVVTVIQIPLQSMGNAFEVSLAILSLVLWAVALYRKWDEFY